MQRRYEYPLIQKHTSIRNAQLMDQKPEQPAQELPRLKVTVLPAGVLSSFVYFGQLYLVSVCTYCTIY